MRPAASFRHVPLHGLLLPGGDSARLLAGENPVGVGLAGPFYSLDCNEVVSQTVAAQ